MKRFFLVIFMIPALFLFGQENLDTLLLQAVKNNNFDSVQLLVEQGANVNYCDSNQAPVVMWAALKGDLEMVKYLIKKGADEKKKGIIEDFTYGNYNYGNITGIAIARKDLPMVKHLIEECGIDINDRELNPITKTETGWNPLTYALKAYDTLITNYIIRKDTLLNPLQLYAIGSYNQNNYDTLIIKRLILENNSDINEPIINSLFERAICDRKVELTKKLLNFNLAINKLNNDSLSFFALSILNNLPEISSMLISKGANIDQQCVRNKTPMFFAIEANNLDLIKLLVQKGITINHQDYLGRTALLYAIQLNRIEIAEYLIQNAANANILSSDFESPYCLAISRGYMSIVQILKEKKEFSPNCSKNFKPQLFIPPSKQGFRNLVLSEDGNYLLSMSSRVLYLWDLEKRKIIKTFHVPAFSDMAFISSDNQYVITYGKGKMSVWDSYTEEQIICNKLVGNNFRYFPKESKYLYNNSKSDTVLYELLFPEGNNGSTFKIDYGNFIIKDNVNNDLIINGRFLGSNDEASIIICSNTNYDSIFLLDVKNLKKTFLLKTKLQNINNVISYYSFVQLSNDNQWLVMKKSQYIQGVLFSSLPDSLQIYNLKTKVLINLCPGKNIRHIRMASNSKYFGFTTENKDLRIFNFPHLNKPIGTFENVISFCFSTNDEIFISFQDGSIRLFDLYDTSMIYSLSGQIDAPLDFYHKKSLLNIYCLSNRKVTFDFTKGKIVENNMGEISVSPQQFFFNNSGLCGIGTDTSANLFSLDFSSNPFLLTRISKLSQDFRISRILQSNDVGFIAYTNGVKLDIKDSKGREINSLQPIFPFYPNNISFSKDNKFIAIASGFYYYDTIRKGEWFCKKGAFCLMDLKTFDTIYKLNTSKRITSITFSPDNNIWVGFDNGRIIVFSIQNNSIIREIEIPNFQGRSIQFLTSENTERIYVNTYSEIIVFDPITGLIENRIPIKSYKRIKISETGKLLFNKIEGGGINIWDTEPVRELCALYIFDSLDFVVRTPNGLFDASPDALDKLYCVAGMETIDLEQLKHRYYQPGLLPILLGYSNEKLREVPPFDYVRLFPKKELSIANSQLSIDLTNQGGGIGKLSVFIDNIEIIKDARPGGDADSSNYEMTIPLALDDYARYYRYDTTNVIKVVAWNAEGYLSSRPDTIHYIPSSKSAKGVEVVSSAKSFSKPHLYGLVVGTSDYAGSLIDLQYAAKDAAAFYEALKLGANRLFGEENVSLSLLSTEIPGQEPSLDNIFMQLMEMRKARPDDIVVVYFSGHGVNYGGQDGEFYYLTMTADGADAAYLNDPMVRKYRTISSQDLAFELNQIPARKKVLILDACSSGQAANNLLASLKDIPSSQKRALEFTQDATGSHILASSAPNSVSYETNIYRQGLLTYALLKGMRGGQLNKIEESEFIDVEQLLQYAKAEVPALAKSVSGIQEPIYRNPQGTSFIIGQITEEDKEKIKLAEPKPVFLPSIFTNLDLGGEDIRLADQINSQLDQAASKGTLPEIQFAGNASNYPDAYRITGNYIVKGEDIEINYILKKGDQKICKPQVESGRADNINQVIESLIKKIMEMIQY